MLRSRWFPLLLALLVTLPALSVGAVLDDWLQRALVRGQFGDVPWWDLFTFTDLRANWLADAIRSGPYPWFTSPELRLHFFRPLSSLLIRFDTFVFGDAIWPQHLHTSLWYVGLTAVAAGLYRRWLGAGVAALAAVLFAIDDAHAIPAVWLANRNALVAVTFAWLGLWAHLRWREDGWSRGRWLSVAAFVLALSAGETAIAALAYVFAYEAFGRRESLRHRAAALSGLAAAVVLFAVLYALVGAGARASSTYIDPLAEPLKFLANAPTRFLANVGGQSFGLPADFWLSLPVFRPVLVVLGLLALVVWPLAWRRWAPVEEGERRRLGWLAAGAVLSLLPTLATFPATRLWTAPSLGVAAVVGTFLSRAWSERGWRRALGVSWLVLAFGLQPLTSWLSMTTAFRTIGERTRAAVEHLAVKAGDRVVVVDSSDFAPAIYGVPMLLELGRPLPATWHICSIAPREHRLTRASERVLELDVIGGHMVEDIFAANFRAPEATMALGARVELDGMSITVTRVHDGMPATIRIELALQPEAYLFIRWDGDALVPVALPPIGESIVLPRADTMFERLLLPGRR